MPLVFVTFLGLSFLCYFSLCWLWIVSAHFNGNNTYSYLWSHSACQLLNENSFGRETVTPQNIELRVITFLAGFFWCLPVCSKHKRLTKFNFRALLCIEHNYWCSYCGNLWSRCAVVVRRLLLLFIIQCKFAEWEVVNYLKLIISPPEGTTAAKASQLHKQGRLYWVSTGYWYQIEAYWTQWPSCDIILCQPDKKTPERQR